MRSGVISVLMLGSVLAMADVKQKAAEVPAAEQIQKIEAAAPSAAYVQPARPRKLLVFTLCKGFRHEVIPLGAKAAAILGQKTGAYQTVISDDVGEFAPDKLRQYDAVCFMNTTGELFEDPVLKQSLLDFVKSGKGIVGIHAATDCFYQWPEFGELMGAYFDGHPWNETVTVKLDEPEHPVNAAFEGKSFEVADEIYQFRSPYARGKLRVLLSLDTAKTDIRKSGIKRADGDFAVSWVRNYDQGRVFYCSLGHRDDVFWNPKILRHYLAGIQFVLGDLKADAAPRVLESQAGWTPLFNGRDLSGWTCKPGSWVVEDGALARKGGGDIWTKEQFGDFILELEFKIEPKTNSGIFLRTGNISDCVQTGIEVQVLDSYGKPQPDKHDCGAIYDCLAPSKNTVRPAGEWNRVVLTCQGSKINVAMNGEPIIDMNLDEWTQAGKNPDGTANKFRTAYKDMPRVGYIGFQDHGQAVWYRTIRLKPLAKTGPG